MDKRYTLSFTIRDGDHEYYGDTWGFFDHEPTEQEQIDFVIRQYSGGDTDAETEEIIRDAIEEYNRHGYFEETPGYRHFSDIGIERNTVDTELLICCKLALDFWNHKNPAGKNAFDRIKNAVTRAESV